MKKIVFRKAEVKDIDDILTLYNELIDHLDQDINYPKWTRDYYPNLDYIKNKVNLNEVYLLEKDNEIIGSTVLNSSFIEDYEKVNWSLSDLKNNEILSIHTFAIKDNLRGKGIGKIFIDYIIKFAQQNNYKSIRLDTINGNKPALSFYNKVGFKDLGEYELHYEETDERHFNLFERNLI